MSQAIVTPVCTRELIDVHAHCLFPPYKKALLDALAQASAVLADWARIQSIASAVVL